MDIILMIEIKEHTILMPLQLLIITTPQILLYLLHRWQWVLEV